MATVNPPCSICGEFFTLIPGYGWCDRCEHDRLELAEWFLSVSGTTWLYDRGADVLRKVRDILEARE